MALAAYKPCCGPSAAAEPPLAFCPSCGAHLLRCIGFRDCGRLLGPGEACPSCVAPRLSVDVGAMTAARVGDRIAVPFVLGQEASATRPLVVLSIGRRVGDEPTRALALGWDTVGPGAERRFVVDVGPFEAAGEVQITLEIALASRAGALEERYLFEGGVRLSVEAAQQASSVTQVVNLAGATLSDAGMINLPMDARGAAAAQPERARAAGRTPIRLERLERREVEAGLRGDPATGLRVSADVAFVFQGFPEIDRPRDGARIGARGVFEAGRLARRFDAEANPEPVDLSLRLYGPDGALDEAASMRLSRRAFELFVACDRLHLRAVAQRGVLLDDRPIAQGVVAALSDGARIAPIPDEPRALAIVVRYLAPEHGVVGRLELRREPAPTTR